MYRATFDTILSHIMANCTKKRAAMPHHQKAIAVILKLIIQSVMNFTPSSRLERLTLLDKRRMLRKHQKLTN